VQSDIPGDGLFGDDHIHAGRGWFVGGASGRDHQEQKERGQSPLHQRSCRGIALITTLPASSRAFFQVFEAGFMVSKFFAVFL
jgi:hypothetical protein